MKIFYRIIHFALFWAIVFDLLNCQQSHQESTFAEYKPHYRSSTFEEKYVGDAHLSTDQFNNITQVLRFYGEEFRVTEDGRVLITKDLDSDWELVWNYTIKSNDANWLKTHTVRDR